MPTTNGNRKILDLKRWEFVTPAPIATSAGSFVASSRHFKQQQLYLQGASAAYIYNPNEDGFIQIPNSGLTPGIAAGASATAVANSVGSVVASTTIAAGSNGATLPQSTINVAAITGFPLAGAIYVDTATNGRQLITYTSASGTQLLGCSGGTGTLATSQAVSFAGLLALSGSTTQIVTNQLLARDLKDYAIHILSGPNSGSTVPISGSTFFVGSTTIAAGSNGAALPQSTINVASTAGFAQSGQILVTISGAPQLITYTGITATSFTGCTGGTGALATSQAVQFASTITVPAQTSAFTTSTVFRLITPAWYVHTAGTLAAGSFKKYDLATNTWSTLSNLAVTLGTDSKLIATPSWIDNDYLRFATGSASSGTSTTLVDSTKNWTVNQWTEFQVRIVSGTGAGQVRRITSNTSTALTVSGWNVNPDSTSTYSIEGNEDYIYLIGNAAVTMYRYSISNNSWTTLSPNVARAAAPGSGLSGHWIYGVTDSAWTNENSIINGRRLYSFRGSGGANLDYYDIPSNTWISTVNYAPITETFTTGTKYVYNGDYLYIQKDATGRFFRYNIASGFMDPLGTTTYTQGAALVGDTMFDVTYTDGTTKITYLYMILNTSAVMLRQMII
jgi:hypothetical protein